MSRTFHILLLITNEIIEIFGNIISPRIHSLNKLICHALTVPPSDSSASLLYGWCFLSTANPPNLQKFNDASFTQLYDIKLLRQRLMNVPHWQNYVCSENHFVIFSSLLSKSMQNEFTFLPIQPPPAQEVFRHIIFPSSISSGLVQKKQYIFGMRITFLHYILNWRGIGFI